MTAKVPRRTATAIGATEWARWLFVAMVGWLGYQYVIGLSEYFTWQGYVGHGTWNRLLVPDTFFYRSVALSGNPVDWLTSAIKNTAGPSMIWWLGRDSYVGVFLINFALFAAIPWQARRVGMTLGLSPLSASRTALIVALLPASAYHTVGALKELPTALLLLSLAHAHLQRNRRRVAVFAILLVFFRLQWLPILSIFLGLRKFARLSATSSARVFMCFFALFPLFRRLLPRSLVGIETVANFRSQREGAGLGANIEYARDNLPGLSLLAIVARSAQSLLEPLVAFANRGYSLVEDERTSVLLVAYVLTAVIVLRPIGRIGLNLGLILFDRRPIENVPLERMVIMLGFSLLMIAGGGIVHFRYLTPMFPLALVVSAALKRGRVRHLGRAHLEPGRQAPPSVIG